jgi:hypothetical protein
MGASDVPFMYQAVSRDDERFPAQTFDPKAVTRASYEPKKPKPKPDGPLVSFNRHPEYAPLHAPFHIPPSTFLPPTIFHGLVNTR